MAIDLSNNAFGDGTIVVTPPDDGIPLLLGDEAWRKIDARIAAAVADALAFFLGVFCEEEERALILALTCDLSDGHRAGVYADWLEERGQEARAARVRARPWLGK